MVTMSASDLLREAKAAFADKKYHKAALLCTKGIPRSKSCVDTQITMLDLRCQAYTKLGKYELALKDARQMIHVSERKASIGFIRCAQLERIEGNYSAAVKWLEHGMKNVPKDRPMLQQHVDKVHHLASRNIASLKPRDPFTVVPLEILQSILSYLDYREIVLLLKVSKTWRSLLLKMEPLTTDVDFSAQRSKISGLSCSVALRRLSRHPRKIVMGSLAPSAEKVMQMWLSKYTNLETLEVLHFCNSNVSATALHFDKLKKITSLELGIRQRVSLKSVFKVISQCQSLKRLCVDGIGPEMTMWPGTMNNQLEILQLHNFGDQPFLFTATQFAQYPNLQNLSISGGIIVSGFLDLSQHYHLRKLHLNLSAQYVCNVSLPESLEELACNDNISGQAGLLNIIEPITLPNLHTVSLRNSWAPTAVNAIACSTLAPKLRVVDLHCLPQTSLEQISEQGFSVLRSCEKLSFKCDSLKDSDITAFAMIFPAVEMLVLEAPQVSGVFISDLVKNPQSRLKGVVLKDCGKVSPDISAWLQARGIEAMTKSSIMENKSARRVREVW